MKSKQKRYNQLIAVDLIDKIKQIEENPPSIPGFTISRLKYLIHLILSHKQKKYKGSYSELNMKYMSNVVPQAEEYLNFLRSEGIIEWINYSARRNSRLYRVVNEGKTEFRTITDQKLIRRIEQNRKNLSVRNSKKYPFLNKWIHKAEIDTEEAFKTIENKYFEDIQKNDPKADGRRTSSLGLLSRIESGEIYIKVNTTNYRLDSNFTNLPKELLPHITINGNHLIEMDISNSQPFFSSCLFEPTKEIEDVIRNYLGESFIIFIKSLNLSNYEDVILYRSLVQTGKFYEHMMNKFKENNIPYTDRSDVKEQLFVVLFGKPTAYRYNPAAKLFKEEFPNVQILFDHIKKKNKNRLAILLQRIESYVMLEKVAVTIAKELPDLPFLTRHDSILPIKLFVAGSGNTEKIRIILVNTIKEVTGMIPQGRMKRLHM
jgi:hypothetical protein